MNLVRRPVPALFAATALVAAAAAGAQGNGASSPALLGYVQESKGNFELRLFDPVDGGSERLELSPRAPDLVVWRTDQPVVLTVGAAGVYAIRYRPKPVTSETVGDPAPRGVTPHDGWLGTDGKSLRVVASSAGRCALYEVPAEGAWKPLATPPARPAADDDACEKFADQQRPADARSTSSARLLRAQPCAAPASACSTLAEARYASARTALRKAAPNADNAAFVDPGASAYYLGAGVATGDTPHLMAPMFVIRRDGESVVKPALKTAKQVQTSLNGSYALVAGEYEGKDPLVVDLRTGKTVLSTTGASAAVWVPRPR